MFVISLSRLQRGFGFSLIIFMVLVALQRLTVDESGRCSIQTFFGDHLSRESLDTHYLYTGCLVGERLGARGIQLQGMATKQMVAENYFHNLGMYYYSIC